MTLFKTEKDKPFEDWPDAGEVLVDREHPDRHLIVIEVRARDPLGRNVVGTLGTGEAYSCSAQTLVAIWARDN